MVEFGTIPSVMTTQWDAVIDALQGIVGYVGHKSKKDLDIFVANAGGKYTLMARDMDAVEGWYNGKKQGYDYCCVTVHWAAVKALGVSTAKRIYNIPNKSTCAGVSGCAARFKAMGRLYDAPRVGDQILYKNPTTGKYTHTGVVIALDGDDMSTIEGNVSVGNGRNGVAVKTMNVSKTSAVYGRPKWTDEPPEPPKPAPEPYAPQKGETVMFTGTVHYTSANAKNGKTCRSGLAKVKAIYRLGQSKHPYSLLRISGKGSTVHGWVDAGDISRAE